MTAQRRSQITWRGVYGACRCGSHMPSPLFRQGMDWLVEKVKTPIQRDSDFYYSRAAESRCAALAPY